MMFLAGVLVKRSWMTILCGSPSNIYIYIYRCDNRCDNICDNIKIKALKALKAL